jgi:hypothetical protein
MLEDFQKSWQKFKSWWLENRTLVLAIFIVTLVIKIIYWQNHQNFTQDNVRDYLFIKNIIDSGQFLIKLGPTTSVATNFSLPPLYYYFYLLAQLIGKGYFYSMDLLIIFLESFTPIVLFYLLSKCTSKRTLIVTLCVLYALSPHVIIYSTSAWNPNLIPLFSSLLILGACRFLIQKSYSGLVLAFLSFFILFNLHFSFFVFVPLVFVLVFFSLLKIKKTYPYIILSLFFILILALPYLIGEINNEFSNSIAALNFLKNDSAAIQYDRLTFLKFWVFFFSGFFGRVFSHELLLYDWSYLYESFSINLYWIISIISFAIVSILAAINTWKRTFFKKNLTKSERFYPLVLISIFLSMAMTLRLYKGDKPDYFLLAFNIFIFIFLALAFNVLKQYFRKKWQNIIISTVLVLLGFLELLAFYKLTIHSSYNAYADYQNLFRFVEKYTNSEITVIPMNQELVIPLTYYFSNKQIQEKPDVNEKHNLLVCYHACINYQPNACHKSNMAKYDLVNYTDFSTYFPYYNFSDSDSKRVFRSKTIQAVLIKQKIPSN